MLCFGSVVIIAFQTWQKINGANYKLLNSFDESIASDSPDPDARLLKWDSRIRQPYLTLLDTSAREPHAGELIPRLFDDVTRTDGLSAVSARDFTCPVAGVAYESLIYS